MNDLEYLAVGRTATDPVTTSLVTESIVPKSPVSPPPVSSTPQGVTALRTAETFNAYCDQVHNRLKEHAVQRRHFLQSAYDRLTSLLHAARAVDDNALYAELWQCRIAAKELLESLGQVAVVPPAPKPVPVEPTPTPRSEPEESTNGLHFPVAPRTSSLFQSVPSPQPSVQAAVSASIFPSAVPSGEPSGPRLPRRPVRPLSEIESDAGRMRDELKDWIRQYPLMQSNRELNVPNCLRLRAIGCRQRRLEEEAGDSEVAEVLELGEDIEKMLDDAGDQEYTVSLDYEIEPLPTAYQWGELAERYDEMARAYEAFAWWNQHWSELTVSDVQPLAEAVAAIQQRFNRLLFRIGARDPFQQQLFDDLRVWAREAQCYLHSLRPKVPIAELIERASQLESAWERAREPVSALSQRQGTIDAVLNMVADPEFGKHAEQDEARLQDALLKCRDMRIPASERSLRDALLPWAAFLEADDRFRDFVREIHLEWERRQEADKHDETEEEPYNALDSLSAEIAAVREVTRGKRLLILGGTCREENRRKLQETLELSELIWPSTKPSDPLAKFDTELRHADIVALLTRFSRKEWKNAQDICAQTNKPFVHLTTGYGVSQVVRHFYTQIAPAGAVHA